MGSRKGIPTSGFRLLLPNLFAMTLRPFQMSDSTAVYQLFYDTIHSINLQDYTPEEIEAWVPSKAPDLSAWGQRFLRQHTLLAEIDGQLAGFANLDADGTNIDMVYTHKDCQGRGVATTLLAALEQQAIANGGTVIELDASITARPFFEKRGYVLVREIEVERRGVVLRNFIMRKGVGVMKKGMNPSIKQFPKALQFSIVNSIKIFPTAAPPSQLLPHPPI